MNQKELSLESKLTVVKCYEKGEEAYIPLRLGRFRNISLLAHVIMSSVYDDLIYSRVFRNASES